LLACNTLALPARAASYARIVEAGTARHPGIRRWQRRFILGGGSNLVLTGDFDGLVLHMAIPGRRLLAKMPKPGTSRPGPARTGTTSCNGRWRKAGRGWKT
jgi:hypothetical protein